MPPAIFKYTKKKHCFSIHNAKPTLQISSLSLSHLKGKFYYRRGVRSRDFCFTLPRKSLLPRCLHAGGLFGFGCEFSRCERGELRLTQLVFSGVNIFIGDINKWAWLVSLRRLLAYIKCERARVYMCELPRKAKPGTRNSSIIYTYTNSATSECTICYLLPREKLLLLRQSGVEIKCEKLQIGIKTLSCRQRFIAFYSCGQEVHSIAFIGS